jgi:hypothetical protein
MKRLATLIIIMLFLLYSCGVEEKVEEIVSGADQLVEEIEGMMGEMNSDTTREPVDGEYSTVIDSTFDGRKGQIPINQTQTRYGITIRLDYLLFDDEPGSFDPPPDGMIFLYPIFTITNQVPQETQIDFASSSSCVLDVDGEEYTREINALLSYQGDIDQLDMTVPFGETEQSMSGFIIPSDWKSITFYVNQMFDATTNFVDLVYKVQRESGTSATVEVLEAQVAEELEALPRIAIANYLSAEEILEVTGLHLVDVSEESENKARGDAEFKLHSDPKADPETADVHELELTIYYPFDAITSAQWPSKSGREWYETTKSGYDDDRMTVVEGVGEEAFCVPDWFDSGISLYILEGDYMIQLDAEEEIPPEQVIALGTKV